VVILAVYIGFVFHNLSLSGHDSPNCRHKLISNNLQAPSRGCLKPPVLPVVADLPKLFENI
jgi:hypothetical protein